MEVEVAVVVLVAAAAAAAAVVAVDMPLDTAVPVGAATEVDDILVYLLQHHHYPSYLVGVVVAVVGLVQMASRPRMGEVRAYNWLFLEPQPYQALDRPLGVSYLPHRVVVAVVVGLVHMYVDPSD